MVTGDPDACCSSVGLRLQEGLQCPIGTDDFLVWDDCFSLPNLVVRVQRAYEVKVAYQDLKGKPHTISAKGELAELLQHEIDHLDGVLAVDRPVGLDPFCIREEWNKHYAVQGRYGEPQPRECFT